jgi:hypothetical protein
MTGRTSTILAAATLRIAVVAIAVRPLLPHHAATAAPGVHTTPTVPPANVHLVALAAANHALACPTSRPAARGIGCGRLALSRTQTTCATDNRCTVELIGTLRTTDRAVPIALTVTLTGAGQDWRAVEVAS